MSLCSAIYHAFSIACVDGVVKSYYTVGKVLELVTDSLLVVGR